MDIQTKMELIERVGEEIITKEGLKQLLETKEHPIAYDGFEPSGLAPIHFGVYRAINLSDLIKAGIHFKLYLADWFAWINNKMAGNLDTIKKVGEYFVEVWRAAGVDMNKVEIVWSSDVASQKEYWKKVVLIAKNTSVSRATRCLTIMGRKEGEMTETAQYFYPMMQTADIFQLGADICQLGIDQRRANMLAREVGPKLGWWKPVVVSHHMLMGLEGAKTPDGYDESKKLDIEISSKMSKSKPSSAIFVHDTKEQIFDKIKKAYCPEKIIENNPMLEFSKYIIFRKFDTLKIDRPVKFGGRIKIENYNELEKMFRGGKIHPVDLKNAVAEHLEKIVKPMREHFEKNKKAKDLYDFVKKQDVTR
jgi:tyrosyl-tRNA synthetase